MATARASPERCIAVMSFGMAQDMTASLLPVSLWEEVVKADAVRDRKYPKQRGHRLRQLSSELMVQNWLRDLKE